jgi:hypothetical protein
MFPEGCAANNIHPMGGNMCTAACHDCNCTQIDYTCDASCYAPNANCLITANSGGSVTSPPLMNNCMGLSCTPESDLSRSLACSATMCLQPTPRQPMNPPVAPMAPPVMAPALCNNPAVNTEGQILVGYFPPLGTLVGAGQQIKVWVTDENPPFIAPNEQTDHTTGQVITPGDRTAVAADGYKWEPALYIAPSTAEDGGTAIYPNYMRGDYCNTPPTRCIVKGPGPAIEPAPAGSGGLLQYTAEFIWDVSALNLTPGQYIAEFVIHDGDRDRGVGCVNIQLK